MKKTLLIAGISIAVCTNITVAQNTTKHESVEPNVIILEQNSNSDDIGPSIARNVLALNNTSGIYGKSIRIDIYQANNYSCNTYVAYLNNNYEFGSMAVFDNPDYDKEARTETKRTSKYYVTYDGERYYFNL